MNRDHLKNKNAKSETFSGWGRTAPSKSVRCGYGNHDDAASIVRALASGGSSSRGAIARGLGRAYGSAAQNAGGAVLIHEDTGAPFIDETQVHLDSKTGVVHLDASVSLDALMRFSVPRGWFVPVTPGTRFVTVGGAIASDIHGKNHHRDGSIGSHIVSMDLLLADGSTRSVSPTEGSELFWATVGGMGLTGVILSASMKLISISSSSMQVETERAHNLGSLTESMRNRDNEFRYSVAWIDMLSTGDALGRGILMRGDHADADTRGSAPLDAYSAKTRLVAPPVPNGLLNKYTVKAFNEAWFRKAPRTAHTGIESIPQFFHPLDAVKSWNRLYGPNGFIQYQFVIPIEAEATLRAIVERFAKSGVASFLAVLKLFGEGNQAPLSFPEPGWTLALDLPAHRSLPTFLTEIDAMVIDAGGRHYLAKDSHITRDIFEAGYPRLTEWKRTKAEVDPQNLWVSDLGRRLGLC
jgi:decaprenylphospho-beta-D-ribofuranose 2-oxidase